MFKVTPKGVLFLLSYFPGYRIHLYIPATHFFYGVYQQLHIWPQFSQRSPLRLLHRGQISHKVQRTAARMQFSNTL